MQNESTTGSLSHIKSEIQCFVMETRIIYLVWNVLAGLGICSVDTSRATVHVCHREQAAGVFGTPTYLVVIAVLIDLSRVARVETPPAICIEFCLIRQQWVALCLSYWQTAEKYW